ncbi:mycothione reductase [Rothia sp. ZJ1223]|uniref:mycothione reductase n=1 Tax=Rothia sp. ZJ1223 TaxID=2811098 RepID=UPI00195AF72A|nr:mycothione reductase [Rothia sp. ZJ1223]MBM7050777.1 mycothione reductase [Rothia sp. ZJ1223]
MTIQEFDLIIIGSGSGNSIINEEWDNKKVAIIDGGTFGGTCLNFGCIPTKQYVYPATLGHNIRTHEHLGIKGEVTDVDWSAMRDRIFARIDAISAGGRDYRAGLGNVTLFEEYAHFIDTHTLETESGKQLTSPQIVIATGSRSVLPDVPGIDGPNVHTSDTVMRIDDLPARVVVIGGGFIAAEFAHVFNGLGSQVIQANRSDVLLRKADAEVSEKFAEQAAKQWDLRLNHALTEIREQADGSAVVVFDHEGERVEVETDLVLVATGRKPNSDTLSAEKFFDVDDQSGLVAVDAQQRVLKNDEVVEGVFALGDVSSPYQLKHVANAEARTVQHNLTHPDALRATDSRYVPAAVFTHPQIAQVGLVEKDACELAEREGFELAVKVQHIGDVAYGWAMEDSVGFVKLLANKETGELLGAHIMGEEASSLIQPLIQAMQFGLPAHRMARGQYWIHPALAEVVENALLGLETEH